jgi:TPR repeat protein
MITEPGSLYVLVNSSYPGLIKVGFTTRQLDERVAELSRATGVPTPFVLAYDHAFADVARAEHAVHGELERLGLRINSHREFFRGTPTDAIHIIQAYAAAESARDSAMAAQVPDAAGSRTTTAARLLAEAERHRHGLGDTLQDLAEAARLYHAAANAGSLVALERLAMLYARHHTDRKAGRRRALRLLKQGAAAGNYYCLAGMAELFAQEQHLPNFIKAWAQFFTARAARRCEEAEAEAGRFAVACRSYIGLCFDFGLLPQHVADMESAAEAIQLALIGQMDHTGADTDARYRLARMLRWAYENFSHGSSMQELPAEPRRPEPRRRLWWERPALAMTAG